MRCAIVTMFVVMLVVAGAAPATASCAAESGPKGSAVIFVGTPTEFNGGYTRMAVSEVWAGPDLSPHVWVLTGQESPGVQSSVDVELVTGTTYVIGATKDLRASACSVAELSDTARVAGLQPADPRMPVADGDEGTAPPIGVLTIALAVGAVGVGTLAVVIGLRRRRF